MKRSYYLFNPGRMSRKDNTLKFIINDENGQVKEKKFIPIEGISDLYIFGSIDANSSIFNFLGKNHIPVHFFDYYEHYTGSFMPKEYLLAGKMHLEQAILYTDSKKRLILAKCMIEGACFNILKNLRYYNSRGKNLETQIASIEKFSNKINDVENINGLMGLEGNIRQSYYSGFDFILEKFKMDKRSKMPPKNEVNTLISFGNGLCYSKCLDAIYHSQMNPTISFLHEPGSRRYSLALDLAEIFKPILTDRVIFRIINKGEIKSTDFSKELNGWFLKESGRKTFVRAFEERLNKTIMHRELKKKVSYKYLIRLECYKLAKHILGIKEYRPFKIWW